MFVGTTVRQMSQWDDGKDVHSQRLNSTQLA